MTHETQFLDLPDQRIAYYDLIPRPVETAPPSGGSAGHASEAVPLVLLHGGVVDKRMWHPQLKAFPDRRVIVPDARGHGESSDAEAPYRLADDVVALLDALEIDRAVLIGLSMGGSTAVDVALEHPGRAAALVASGTGTSEPEFTDPWTLQVLADWQRAQEAGDLEEWLGVTERFVAGPARSIDEVDPAVRELCARMARETVTDHLRVGEDGVPIPPQPPTPVTRTWERLEQVTVPVLALCGALDSEDHRALGRRLAETVADGSYREVAGAAHYPNLENPEDFNDALQRFLHGEDRSAG
ncbi:alpha/beta fold hydrolase [Brachybacterium sp. GCM10030267]|uniref:alpha/beta fold hydrolase n=1 Tax=unclassified Brachybacterium TaxID=2623841 RepID=UPI00360B90E4